MRYIEIVANRQKEFKATKEEIAHLRILLNKEAARKDFYFLIKKALIAEYKKIRLPLYKDDVEKHLTEIYQKGINGYIKAHEKDFKKWGILKKDLKKYIDIEKRNYDAPYDPKIEKQINVSYQLLERNRI